MISTSAVPQRRVLVLVNPRAGLGPRFAKLRRALETFWDVPGNDLLHQFSRSREDGMAKAQRAVEWGADMILVAGGDGTINSVGQVLMGTRIALGAIPLGSGNGFARHFGIPLAPLRAVEALARSEPHAIDVGLVGPTPFFVTCSMAWDATVAEGFARFPVRGILPYVFAGVQQLFEYRPQPITVELDGNETLSFKDPMVFTIANLSQYGGGAKIAPQARADDGWLELVVTLRQDSLRLLSNIRRLFDGTIHSVPEVIYRRFKNAVVRRERAHPIQVDGELVEAPAELRIGVRPLALNVLVPSGPVG